MKFTIRHEIKGRIRIHLCQNHMTMRQADLLAWFLSNQPMVEEAKVYERTADAVIHFCGERKELIRAILDFTYEDETLNEIVPMDSGRELNQEYQDKLVNRCLERLCTKLFLPAPVRAVYTTIKAIRYVWKGIRCLMKCKIEVEVLDATAIAVSIIRNDFDTAGSVMFLLGIGELLEEWTHKKSVGDLARSMSLNIEKVWQKINDTEVLVPVSDIREGDLVVVHTGNVIPLDGIVEAGEAMVNQASMTGESVPVKKDEMLRIAACLEEHFPHSMANAVVQESISRGLVHEEMHSKVDYIVAHGIASYIGDERVIIGSNHFVFEDEKCVIPESEMDKFDSLPPEYSHLYLAIGGRLAAVICIEDPLRPESTQVIKELRKLGISKIVMMTGDSDRTAKAIAAKVGVDEYYSEVLPEDKVNFVEKEKTEGRKVIMIGDGINDSPALSAANVGIAISEGAQIAREIADITISEDALYQLVTLKEISNRLMKRVHWNYRFVIGFNLGLILLGVSGVLAPATSALMHNTLTLLISLKSMTNLLDHDKMDLEMAES